VLPTEGKVFLSVRNEDKEAIVPIARELLDAGFELLATSGTHAALGKAGIESTRVPKLSEGRPNIKDHIKNGDVGLLINTPTRKGPQTDEGKIRALAVLNKVPMITTLTGASAAVKAIAAIKQRGWDVRPLQAYHDLKK